MAKKFVSNDLRTFRPEIEGLRAVAATLVMVYHIFLGRVSGGVDVFFLIAGFLITGSLLRQVERYGRVFPGQFFTRLGKRLLPNALVVLVAVIIGTWIWIPLTQRAAAFKEVIASTFYYENWALISKATDYLASEETASPVQHFWAMSIQGQFYVIWVALFGLLLLFNRKRIRVGLGIALATLFLVSFAFSVYYTELNQPVAYFHTGARVWEFAAGGLFALVSTKIPHIPDRVRIPISWLGLAAVVLLGVLLPVGTLFPGYVALLPIIGALLVLLAGPSESRWSATAFLSSRPMVYLGGVSYGLYLWHWPILIFYKHYSGREVVGPRSGIAIIVVSLLLAIVSTRLIEKPIRESGEGLRGGRRNVWLRRMRPAGVICLGVAVVAVSAAFSVKSVKVGEPKLEPEIAGDHPGALARAGAEATGVPPGSEVFPDILTIAASPPEHYAKGCHQNQSASDVIECHIGAEIEDLPEQAPKIMVIGGSHSAHWIPPVSKIAEAHNWEATAATKSACLFSTDPPGDGAALDSCRQWNANVMERLATDSPDLVIMTSTRDRGDDEHVPAGYVERWKQLDELGIPVLAIRDNPRSKTNWLDCLISNSADHARCDQPRDELLSSNDPTSFLDPVPSNVYFVDYSDVFCDEEYCSGVIGNVVVYRDAHHLTEAFALSFAPLLEPEIIYALDQELTK